MAKRDSDAAGFSGSQTKKSSRQVTVATFKKWQTQHEKSHATLTWLRCDSSGQHVEILWCAVCKKFEDKIKGVKNFSCAWVVGSTNAKVSNVLDHARSEQHRIAMVQF